MVKHKDSFWGKYYAGFVGNISDYWDFFSGGAFDSQSWRFDAYTSKSKTFVNGGRRDGLVTRLALKYYPSRGNSIGLVRTDVGHILESGFEVIDGSLRNISGMDNLIYDMHNYNSRFYLKYRSEFR